MSSIQPSSGAPMPPGAAVGPAMQDPAIQAQIAEVQTQLNNVNEIMGAGQPTGFDPGPAPTGDRGFIGMQGTSFVDSLQQQVGAQGAPGLMGAEAMRAIGGGGVGGMSRLGEVIEQARIRRDIDEQMADLAPVSGGGAAHLAGTQPDDADKFADQMLQEAAAASGVPADQIDELREMAGTDPAGPGEAEISIETAPYSGGGRVQTGLYTGDGDVQLASGAASRGAASIEEQELQQLLAQMTPEELAQFEAELAGMDAGGAGGGATAI